MAADPNQIRPGLSETSAWQPQTSQSGHNFNNVTITGTAVLGDVYGANGDMLIDSRAAQQREAIIRALAYHGMNDKRRTIESADPRSLEWIRTSDYVRWLKSDDRLFWFNGKPGSGKSTLMKHLTTTALTRNALPKDGLKWYVTWFFFDFRSGENLANTPEGMLRAILFQWVKHDENIPKVLGEGDMGSSVSDMTVPVLLERFALVSQDAQSRLCIFIDGLDECQTPLTDLMDTILQLKEYTSSKICLASRPYPTVKEILCSSPRICLRDHSSQIIRSYLQNVASRLEDSLLGVCPPALIEFIVNKADGVVLWARFAFEQILEGCRMGEDVSTLMNRCDGSSPQVNNMFEASLQKIPERFCLEAASYLLLIDSSEWPLSTTELQTLSLALQTKFPHQMRIPQVLGIDQFERRLLVLLGSLININPVDVGGHIRPLTKWRGLATTCPRAWTAYPDSELNTITSVHETFHTYLQTSTWYWNHLETLINGTQSLSPADFILSIYATSMTQLSDYPGHQILDRCVRQSHYYRLLTDRSFRSKLLKDYIQNSISSILIPLRLLSLLRTGEISGIFQETIRHALRSGAMLPILACLSFTIEKPFHVYNVEESISALLNSTDIDIFWAFLGPAEGYIKTELSQLDRHFCTAAGEQFRDVLWQRAKCQPGKSLSRAITQYFERGSSLCAWHYWDLIGTALCVTHSESDLTALEYLFSPSLFRGPRTPPTSILTNDDGAQSTLADVSDSCVWYRLALEKYDRGNEDANASLQWMMDITHLLTKSVFFRDSRSTKPGGRLLGQRLSRAIVASHFWDDPRSYYLSLLYQLSLDAPADAVEIITQGEIIHELSTPEPKVTSWKNQLLGETGAIRDMVIYHTDHEVWPDLDFYKKLCIVFMNESPPLNLTPNDHEIALQSVNLSDSPLVASCYADISRYNFDPKRDPRWCLND